MNDTGRRVTDGGVAAERLPEWRGRVARASWLYRWLTAETEPEVIVTDLSETWTVGPVIAALDRATVAAARLARRTGLVRASARARAVYERSAHRRVLSPIATASNGGWPSPRSRTRVGHKPRRWRRRHRS